MRERNRVSATNNGRSNAVRVWVTICQRLVVSLCQPVSVTELFFEREPYAVAHTHDGRGDTIELLMR